MKTARLIEKLGGASGCDYLQNKNLLFFVEMKSGRISTVTPSPQPNLNPQDYKVLGTGYNKPMDIAVTSDGQYAYVIEMKDLIKVDLNNANRNPRNIIASGFIQPHQMALDETRNQVYVVDYAESGNLVRIDLKSGTKMTLIDGLCFPVGMLMTNDFQYAYVTEAMRGMPRGQSLSRITLNTGKKEVIFTGLIAPMQMKWADSSESSILIVEVTQRKVIMVDLKSAPIKATPIVSTPAQPFSIAVAFSNMLLVSCLEEIVQISMGGQYFNSGAPLLMGIGFVPFDHIKYGYADTTVNPKTNAPEDYFFSVKDSPFGGNLPIMFNHEKARMTGKYYSIKVDGKAQTNGWSDYKWEPSQNAFMLTPAKTKQDDPTKFCVRQSDELWYNQWLGYFLDTAFLPNGLHTINVTLFNDDGTTVPDELSVLIDNGWPQASIDQILHDGQPVKTCDIVKSGSRYFTFRITAQDAMQNLLSWNLTALWGDNQSKLVDKDDYAKHISDTKKWQGKSNEIVPDVSINPLGWDASTGDQYSTHCAHTFRLAVWDRVINGWNYLHYSEYNKFITIDVQ